MGLIFALFLIGLPLVAAYIDMQQTKGVKNIWGFDLPATGGYTPKWDKAPATTPVSTPMPKPAEPAPMAHAPVEAATPNIHEDRPASLDDHA